MLRFVDSVWLAAFYGLAGLLSPTSPLTASGVAVQMGVQVEDSLFYGQSPPGLVPVPFAPDVLRAGPPPHGSIAFSPAGSAIYWTQLSEQPGSQIVRAGFDGTALHPPEALPFASGFWASGVDLTRDGRRLFFGGGRLTEEGEETGPRGIWTAERRATGWSEPKVVESTGRMDWYSVHPTLSRTGNLYFAVRFGSERYPRLYRSELVRGRYGPPEPVVGPLADEVVTDPYVDPDERFVLFMGDNHAGRHGISDLFISYREEDGTWSASMNLAPLLGQGPDAFLRFPFMSPDGRYLFFVRTLGNSYPTQDTQFYWVSAEVLPERARD